MTLITWNNELNLGIENVDSQHKHLVDIINKFDEAMGKDKDSRAMNEILNDLVGYTQEHFADEEKIMAAAGYEGLKKHQARHRQLLQKVERLQFEFNTQHRPENGSVREFLKIWLTSHILEDDKEFAAVQAQKIVSP